MNEYWIEIDGYRYDLEERWTPRKVTYEDEFDEYGHHRLKNPKVQPATFIFKDYSTKDKPTLEYILKRFSSFKCDGTNITTSLTFVYDRTTYEIEGNKIMFYGGDFLR